MWPVCLSVCRLVHFSSPNPRYIVCRDLPSEICKQFQTTNSQLSMSRALLSQNTLISQNIVSTFPFYAPPQKVAGYYVIPSELLCVCPSVRLSVRPSVRPSAVDHSCPLYNFDTVQDNFTKLGTNVKHDQTTCRD